MRTRRWFLPESPDVLGMLAQQTAITVEGMEALHAWASGDTEAAPRLRADEHRADGVKRELRKALTTAFTTPLEAEDLFELSLRLDDALNGAKNTVREAEVMGTEPDEAMAEMAGHLAAGTQRLADALAALAKRDHEAATATADQAIKSQRDLEHVYRAAMSALVGSDNLREVAGRRELYRRLSRTADCLVEVAERVWYAVLKQG